MDIQFFCHPSLQPGEPEPQWPQWPMDEEPAFILVALHRSADPDAGDHDGNDYLGGYGDLAAMKTWAAEQEVELISVDKLPNPPAFYPSPFNEA